MRNYISVTSRGVNKKFLGKIFEHNVERLQRGETIDYLLKEKDSLGSSTKFVNNGKFEQLNDFEEVKNKFEKLERQRQKIIDKRINKSDYLQSHLVEFVVALSEEQSNFYLDNNVDLNTGIEKLIENLKEKYNIESLMYSAHFDEGHYENNEVKRNIHFHIVSYNYDLKNEKAILSNFSKQDFRDLQTLTANSFKSVGLDFQRGISKKISKKEHLRQNDFILDKQKKEFEQIQKNRKEEYYLAKSVKNEIKELRNNFERDSIEFEQLTKMLNVAREEEKNRSEKNRIEFESSKEQREFISAKLKSVLQKHLKNEKIGILNKEDITKVENKNELFKDLILEFEKMKKIDIQNLDYNNTKNYANELMKDIKEFVKKIDILESDNRKLLKENKNYKEQQENFVKNFGNFKEVFTKLEEQNNKYKDFILENRLTKNFENFRKIEDKDNNLLFNFSRD